MAGKLKPGDVGWTHPDVRGDTNPKSIKALSDAIDSKTREQQERVLLERVNNEW